MANKHKSFPEKTYKANIIPDGFTYRIPPMEMIKNQIRRDSMAYEERDNSNERASNEKNDVENYRGQLVNSEGFPFYTLPYNSSVGLSGWSEWKNDLKNEFAKETSLEGDIESSEENEDS